MPYVTPDEKDVNEIRRMIDAMNPDGLAKILEVVLEAIAANGGNALVATSNQGAI